MKSQFNQLDETAVTKPQQQRRLRASNRIVGFASGDLTTAGPFRKTSQSNNIGVHLALARALWSNSR